MAKSKIPRTVNVLGHDYQVRLVKPASLGGNTVGRCHHPKRLIEISNELSKEERWLIFLHEIRHAYQFESGDTQIMQSQTQEKDCEQFASFVSSLQKQGVL